MYKIDSTMSDSEVKKYSILNRIERLEMANDRYMATFGCANEAIYNEIQKLYDAIDSINSTEDNYREADRLHKESQDTLAEIDAVLATF